MAIGPLPDSRSSLSKYIPLLAHYKLLSSIKNDTPVRALQATFDPDVVATARKRYLIEQSGVVRRDKLIDLIQEEKKFTDRVKMLMYFLFLFQDSRYRNFICNDVARKDGHWDPAAFLSERDDVFPRAGGRKAFTNLRQLLVQANLLDETFGVREFPSLEIWFPNAVEIVAPHIEDAVARRSFLSSPQAFLIKHGLQGLLNTTAQLLAIVELPGIYEESIDLLPAYSIDGNKSTLTSPSFKTWNRKAPLTIRNLQPETMLTNPALLERAHGQHFLLEQMMVELCTKERHVAKFNMHIDLFIQSDEGTLLFEMKSCTITSTRSQIRRAVNQVFEYAYLYRQEIEAPIQRCIVMESKPCGTDEWLIKYVESLAVGLVWKRDNLQTFGCSKQTLKWLKPFLSSAKAWVRWRTSL